MKSQLKKSFDKAATTYCQNANIQRIAALKLVRLIEKDYYENILELGIGVGLFTDYLIKKVKFKNYTAIDLSLKSLQKAKERLKRINFVNADIESLPLTKTFSFDLMVGSSVLQWLQNPQISIPRLFNETKSGCEVYFSIFIKGTFAEMEHIYSLTNFGHTYSLKSENFYKELFTSIRGFRWQFERKDYTFYYNSVVDFLKQHKNTGATYSKRYKRVTKQAYVNFCNLYEEIFSSSSGKIPSTYSILYVKGIKNS
ncbi:methyltransferase domain-containing protein [Hippea maritima]|uniref:Methyltransferase type 11 n=1 Tax=Hippea maritima (strain ATCC 700847 / DSM 10411 / MH2) TaxID=760142 RepID=F2LTY1_HIPMA|nr:methyltransferase domain-containing protein [Hippea maritima]AEA33380.1 Methyltransferase type 11 [Hippea maritima DSM 10411]